MFFSFRCLRFLTLLCLALFPMMLLADEVAALRARLAENPALETWLELGSALGKQKRYSEALEEVSRGLESFPENRALLNLQGLLHYRLEQREQAKAAWQKVLATHPDDDFARRWIERIAGSDRKTVAKPAVEQTTSEEKGEKLSLEKQQELAVKIYSELATTDKWDLSTHESLHREVIKKCPDTKKAQESCWRLSTLYTYGFEPVEHEKIIEVLELFCSRYKQSPLHGEVYDRLLNSYQETGRSEKVIELLATRLFQQQLSDDDFVNYALALSQAYEDNGQFDAARSVYQEILKRDDGKTYASVVAQRQLEN